MVGVYRITNTVTDRVYIGSTANIERRLAEHRYKLSVGKHSNIHLQSSWGKHGELAFIFEPLVECSVDTLLDREQRFIDAYIFHGLPVYNMKPSSESHGGFGYRHTDETKEKIGAASRGRIVSEATREKLSLAGQGRKTSGATKEKLRAACSGWKHSEETKAKIRSSKRLRYG